MTATDSTKNTTTTKHLTKTYLDVLGICCTSEVPIIDKILKPLDGVKEVSVIVPSKTVIVIHDSLLISDHQIVRALNKARLEASVRVNGGKQQRIKWPSPFAICCGILLLFSFLKYIYEPLQWLAVVSAVVGAIPITLKALASLRNLNIDINILMLIAVVGSLILRDYWEAATIVFLFTISEWLQSTATHQAKDVMSSLVNVVPQKALLAESGEEVNANEVKLNSIVAVKAGEVIPIDGVVVDGECEVDEKTLTGESFPVTKQKHSTVWAATINLNGYISIKTTAVAKDCVVARMAKLVEEAQTNKSKTQRYIDQIAKYYTPAVVAICIALAILPSALKLHNRNEWYHLALVALVSACPCALVLSTPVAMFCALSKAATSGLLFKGTDYLETLAKVRIMAFDKTGTLTRGQFSVTQFNTFLHHVDHNRLLYWVSSIEGKSSHPMATALTDYAYLHSVTPKPERVEQFQNFPGEGIYGRIDGMEIFIGNKKISSRAQCTTVPELDGDGYEGKSISYIFLGSSPAGIFSLADVCRTGAKEALGELKLMGIKTVMLTGDCYAAAVHVQDQLGGALESFHAELLPEDKAKLIKEFKKEGAITAMTGDGLNDAPALATADVGLSMGVSGSALAMETGHVILTSNDLQRIPKAIKLARRVRRKIIENVIVSITIKAAILALAISGHPFVWAAVFADVGSCLIVIFNSLLLLRGRRTPHSHTHKHGHKCCSSSSTKSCSSVSQHTHQHCKSSHTDHQSQCPESTGKKGCHSHDNSHPQMDIESGKDHGHHDCSNHSNYHQHEHEEHHHHHQHEHEEHHHHHHHHHHHQHEHDEHHHHHQHDEHDEHHHHQHDEHDEHHHHQHEHDEHHHHQHEHDEHDHHLKGLKKLEIGGCCKSFRSECCGKSSHHGSNFGGTLPEIVIE
ncbi:PREDICTED: putative inactive cadmium/zinc-transporting ATPase HMA3 [Ipomoea nil]|uniref:putative inactive cadmium/zinc-transporting ATPase HMA3 n=1 Tax=Ipomoea nil TaxID=35883 RepID=UPI000900A45B|nr:PREDICTED: putative inactive cadmium/zinc-transporting ATPase HMA3 [Ipomoea nil]